MPGFTATFLILFERLNQVDRESHRDAWVQLVQALDGRSTAHNTSEFFIERNLIDNF